VPAIPLPLSDAFKVPSCGTGGLFTPLNVYPVKCEAYLTGAEHIYWGVPDMSRYVMLALAMDQYHLSKSTFLWLKMPF